MLRTKNFISDIHDVPVAWVFENYLTLPESLTGQDIKIKSIFGAKDKNPSFFIYYSKTAGKYKWKDFSAGKHGDHIELVKEIFNLGKRYDAGLKIINDYNDFIASNGTYKLADFKIRAKYKVKTFKIRSWTESDAKYWLRFRIGSSLLEKYNVTPLDHFVLKKDGQKKELTIRSTKIYGFFRKDGSLYKIYQPMSESNKFFKVKDYIQGTDQLTFQKPYLVVCSSLKDIMAFEKMGFRNAEAIAPDSENVLIPEKTFIALKERYRVTCTLFDNDPAGIKSMIKYREQYKVPAAHLKLEKDLSDCIEVHGVNNTREILYPILTKALTGTIKELPE